MTPVEAIAAFDLWSDRTALPILMRDYRMGDRWPEAATGACIAMRMLDDAADDDDLLTAAQKFTEVHLCRSRWTIQGRLILEKVTMHVMENYSETAGRDLPCYFKIFHRNWQGEQYWHGRAIPTATPFTIELSETEEISPGCARTDILAIVVPIAGVAYPFNSFADTLIPQDLLT